MDVRQELRRIGAAGLVVVVGLGVLMAWLVAGAIGDETRSAAEERARLLAAVVVADELASSEIASPQAAESAEAEIAARLAGDGVLGLAVRRHDGTVILTTGQVRPTFAVDERSSLMKAFEGRATSEEVTDDEGRSMIATYVPLALEGDGGHLQAIAEVYQDPSALGGKAALARWSLTVAAFVFLIVVYAFMMRSFRIALEGPRVAAVAQPDVAYADI